MAAFTTTVSVIGINGVWNSTIGGQVGVSTATSVVTLTCGDASKVVLTGYNPTNVDDITCTMTASTSPDRAVACRGNKVLTTAIASSSYFMIGNLESNWFQSTANTLIFTFSTAIMVMACELTSTRFI